MLPVFDHSGMRGTVYVSPLRMRWTTLLEGECCLHARVSGFPWADGERKTSLGWRPEQVFERGGRAAHLNL